MIFATYAESNEQLSNCCHLFESLREFGGRFSDSTALLLTPGSGAELDGRMLARLSTLGVERIVSEKDRALASLPFAGKVCAARRAEERADQSGDVLVWMDEDTVILQEPGMFDLREESCFAFRPVMHNRTGSLYAEPPDEEWQRIYALLGITESILFPVVTPGDGQTIRAYFNAGLLVVRPEVGILHTWAEDLRKLVSDEPLAAICRDNVESRIFLHQKALVGAVCRDLSQEEMLELPETYNYPLFFHRKFEAAKEFCSIERIVTLRHDVYFGNPDPDWRDRLQGPAEKVTWLIENLGHGG